MNIIENNNERGKFTAGAINHLSASTISSMKTCAKAVYFQKIEGIPNKTQYARTIFGLAIHHALEQWGKHYIETKNLLLLETTIKYFKEYFYENKNKITIWGSKDTFDSMTVAGVDAICAFYETYANKLKPKCVESGFVINRGENKLPIIGYQDLLTEDGCIYDYKCGVLASPAKYICNMTIYAWDYLNKNGELPKKVATLAIKWRTKDKKYYFAGWEEHALPIDEKYLNYAKTECDDIEKKIKAGVFERAEAGCGLCKNCGYREKCGVIIL